MASKFGFMLSGIEPYDDPVWRQREDARIEYWREAAKVGVRVKRASLARGLDKDGKPLRPIHALTRQARRDDVNPVTGRGPYSPYGRAREDAPPLQASGINSRTQRLLRAKPYRTHVWFYWDRDSQTGRDWGEILARHARGFARYFVYPKGGWGFVKGRDVMGLSKADVAAIKASMDQWWKANRPRFVGTRIVYGDEPGMAMVEGLVGGAKQLPWRDLGRVEGAGPLIPKNLPPLPPPAAPVAPRPRPPIPSLAASRALARADVPLPVGVGEADPIPAPVAAQLPRGLRVRTLRQLLSTPAGRWWWLVVGLGLWLGMLASTMADDAEEKQVA